MAKRKAGGSPRAVLRKHYQADAEGVHKRQAIGRREGLRSFEDGGYEERRPQAPGRLPFLPGAKLEPGQVRDLRTSAEPRQIASKAGSLAADAARRVARLSGAPAGPAPTPPGPARNGTSRRSGPPATARRARPAPPPQPRPGELHTASSRPTLVKSRPALPVGTGKERAVPAPSTKRRRAF